MEEFKKLKIEWYLYFLNIDLDKEPVGEIINLIRKMKLIFGRPLHDSFEELYRFVDDVDKVRALLSENLEEIKRLQRELRNRLEKLRAKYHELLSIPKGENLLRRLNLAEINNLMVLDNMSIAVNCELRIRSRPRIQRSRKKRREWIATLGTNLISSSPLEFTEILPRNDNGFLLNLFQALDGVHIASIKQCEECSNWFLQAGERERFFCSDQCRIKNRNRNRRKEIKAKHPRKYKLYKESGKRRARASYERRVQKGNPNIKVVKRT
jgi:predicted nucleic acid-binding Zn ribbon protein